ncbi:hypothetical protein BH09PSE2_BH09PSE2_04300 [soil metagenome]
MRNASLCAAAGLAVLAGLSAPLQIATAAPYVALQDDVPPATGACSGVVAVSAGGVGALAGGLGAAKLAEGKKGRGPSVGSQLAGVGGALAGGLLSSKLACLLTKGEQKQAESAAIQAVEGGVGSRVAWQSVSRPDVSGRSAVTSETKAESGAVCRDVTTVVIVKGEETSIDQRLCRAAGSTSFVVAEK